MMKKQAACTVIAHLPLLRIAQERISFPDVDLWQMPFEAYRSLAGQNLESLEADYRATAPVFLHFSWEGETGNEEETHPEKDPLESESRAEGDFDRNRIVEMRSQKSAYHSLAMMGLISVANQIRGIWSMLALAFPGLLLPDPSFSQIFVLADEGTIGLSNVRGTQVCVQGPADYEYLFFGPSSQPILAPGDFGQLLKILELTPNIYSESFPNAVLESFLDAHSPTLAAAERTTLSVVALEALVMPDITKGLTKTFVRRLANLCPDMDRELPRSLYAARSDEMHATDSGGDPPPGQLAPSALVLLSVAVCRMAELIGVDRPINQIRRGLDATFSVAENGQKREPFSHSPSREEPNRLFVTERTTGVITAGASLAAKEGEAAFWSPLARLEAREWLPFGMVGHPILIAPLNGQEILSLEEKETRADYAAKLLGIDDRVAGFFIPITGSIPTSIDFDWTNAQQLDHVMRLAARIRDFGTIALRLGGFDDFWDPEWHGLALFVGSMRIRRPTVFRQSVLTEIHRAIVLADHDKLTLPAVGPAHASALSSLWAALSDFIEECPPQIERSLVLFRRASDPSFLSPITRARLAYAAIESMLGRFSDPTRALSLEELVTRIMRDRDPDATSWFRKSGRRQRNRVAHNPKLDSVADSELASLLAILGAVLLAYIAAWSDPTLAHLPHPSHRLFEWIEHQQSMSKVESAGDR